MAFNKAKALQEAEKLVGQGKTSQAIKHYLHIYEKDASDPALLNTIGDLYVRDKNLPEALKHFHKLAECYTQDGFTVKAIAIYKKVVKLDPSTVDPLLKMAELYLLQGLGREAREQYAQAFDFYRKKSQNEKALEVLNKIVRLDPENKVYRTRLAEFCEQAGRKGDAAQAYAEIAESAIARGDAAAADLALSKAKKLNPENAQVLLLRARLALSQQKNEEVVKILTASPMVASTPGGRHLLLEAYLALHKVDAAAHLVVEVFRSHPDDFFPLSSFVELCIEKGEFDAALKPLAAVGDELIERGSAGPLIENLRKIWAKAPDHIPALELICRISDKTGDEYTLPEVLEALGHAYVQMGNPEKAEEAFQRLVAREPANEHYKGLLNQVLQQQGKAVKPLEAAELAGVGLGAADESEGGATAAAAAPAAGAEQEALLKEAFENSDLFSRYGLIDKAVAELEKVLEVYPEQHDVHKRIYEICHRKQPERAAQAAGMLAKLFAQRGDMVSARNYAVIAGPHAPAAPAAAPEFDLTAEVALGAPEETPAAAPPIELATTAPAQPAADEFDLSAELDAVTAPSAPAPSPPWATAAPGVEAFNYEDSQVEIDFYLEQGFLEEARAAVRALGEKFQGNPQVAELGTRVEGHAAREVAAPAEAGAPPAGEAEVDITSLLTEPAPVETAPPEIPPPPPEPVKIEARRGPPPPPGPAPVKAAGGLLGDLVGSLESSLEGMEEAARPSAFPKATKQPAPTDAKGAASPLSGLLEELEAGAEAASAEGDIETHYNLGVAFREMGLLDEAIGEFQKAAKGTEKGKFPPHFLQACSLLALCFMEKGMPAIATKWYARALELPGLDDEATLALQYDLGVAFEQAGDMRTALEKYSEVYSRNIDYRDVAEKMRLLQQKSP